MTVPTMLTRPAPRRDGGPAGADNWWLVCTAGLLIYSAQLDTTIVHVALPSIAADLGVRAAVTQWVVLGYLIPLVALSLLIGRWLDTVGHRRALVVGVTGFAITSVAAGLASTVAALVTARLGQGVFAALLLTLAPVLAVQAVRPQARGRALAVVGALAPLGAMSGPLVGGFLVDSFGWPWIFFTNVPVILLALFSGRFNLGERSALRPPPLRWIGEVALLGGSAVVVLLALSLAADRHAGWLLLTVTALPLMLLWRRSSVSAPVRRLLRLPGMAGSHLAFVAAYTALLAVQFLAPFYLARELGLSAVATGTTLLALPAATALAGPVSGVLSDYARPRPTSLAGAATATLGFLLLLPLSTGWGAVDLAWRLAVLGFGFGLFVTPNMTLAMASAPPDKQGLTAATTNLARMLGLALGPALATLAWAGSDYTLTGMRAGIATAALAGLLTTAVLALMKTSSGTGLEPHA